MKKLAVGILLFENVEVLDFAGPFEVFSREQAEGAVEDAEGFVEAARSALGGAS